MENARYEPRSGSGADDELIDTLIAVSVVAKRLAERLRKENASREEAEGRQERSKYVYEQNERAFADTRCADCLR